MKCFW